MAHFGWTYDYLLRGIRWPKVQKMLKDASNYEYDEAPIGNNSTPPVIGENSQTKQQQLKKFLQSIPQ